jgi:hypothetical protein
MPREPLHPSTYHERYCAFVDILGFGELINDLSRGNKTYQEICGILDQIHSPARFPGSDQEADLKAQSISDAICISTKCTDIGLYQMFSVLQNLSIQLLQLGFFVRGAVVKGNLYHDDQMVFGPAQIQAYFLERDVVRYPRIMITTPVVLDATRYKINGQVGVLNQWVSSSTDGPRFLNTIRGMYGARDANLTQEQRENIIAIYNRIARIIQERFNASFDNPRHFEKVQWFAKHWNRHAGLTGANYITRESADGLSTIAV